MEKINYFEKNRFIGETSFSNKLFRDAIYSAVKNIEGVVSLKSDFTLFMRGFVRGGGVRGLSIRSVSYKSIIIDIGVVIKHGYSASKISYQIGEAASNVARDKALNSKRIRRIDVRIVAVV